MAQEEIEFRKLRDFGENLNDTFTFIRQNLKPLLLYFFAICGAFLLGRAILGGIYQSNSFSFLDQFRQGYMAGRRRSLGDTFSPLYFGVLLFSMLSYVAMRVSIAAYIKCYIVYGREGVTLDRVWAIFKAYYFRIFFYSLPLILLMLVGFVFCLVPGVYLLVVLTPFDYIVVM